jgi:hypothetical protein
MKAQLWTFGHTRLLRVENIVISDDYDDNPYGDTIDFAVGCNQAIITDPDIFREEIEDL